MNILKGRNAINDYREEHKKGFHNIEKLNGDLKIAGFDSISDFFKTNDIECLSEAKEELLKTEIYKNRKDLEMLGNAKEYKGIKIIETNDGVDLVIDNIVPHVMNTSVEENYSMFSSVKECTNNARVFIGGLGLGIVLLYLQESKKAKEIIVCEKDERIIDFLGKQITDYVDLQIKIIKGDIYEEIKKNGKFDWIYIDITEGAPNDFKEIAIPFLNNNGIYTPYNPNAYWWWK